MQVCAALVMSSLLAVAADPPAAPGPGAQFLCSPGPAAPPALPADGGSPPACLLPDAAVPPEPPPHVPWFEVWGEVGLDVYFTGRRTAPNGLPFTPLFATPAELNVGLLPHKKLYLFMDTDFWAQRATDGITNPHQGVFDFSKREFDITAGAAWNYWGPLEARVFGYAYNNLNRGVSPNLPYGYDDGVGFENRLYLPTADWYDVAKLSFLSVGYLPSNALVGLDGQQFKPGLLLRAHLTWDLPRIRSYLYGDGQYLGESGIQPRLLFLDAGLAVRPFECVPGLEFRLGATETFDVHGDHSQTLGYGAVQVVF